MKGGGRKGARLMRSRAVIREERGAGHGCQQAQTEGRSRRRRRTKKKVKEEIWWLRER